MSGQIKSTVKGIYLLWLNWVIVAGAISLLVMLSRWIAPLLMPLLAFALQGCCYMLIKANSRRRVPVCFILPHIAVRIFFFSAVIMLTINILHHFDLIPRLLNNNNINKDIPFITVLIVAPVSVICSYYALKRGSSYSFCVDCKIQYGTPAERGFLGKLFTQEGTSQVRLLLAVSVGVTMFAWVYYFYAYNNANISSSDFFMFFLAPLALFIISIIYMALRYTGLWNYYSAYIESSALRNGPYTLIRYLIVWDNFMCILPPENDPDRIADMQSNRYDTPGSIYIPSRKELSVSAANDYFYNKTGVRFADIRFMYSTISGNADYNTFHYLCYATDEEKQRLLKAMPSLEFVSLGKIKELINSGRTNPLFSAEFIRLYTMAMAWKTYDAEGKRLYRIKHYVPTFRIRDIHKWKVDYNDPLWLRISRFNQDSPLYSLRRLWKKVNA